MAQSAFVWFQLVDSTGRLFKKTSFSSVLRASLVVHVVDLFRKAVKAKYADSHLKGVAPSDLIVYENKAAFDEGKTVDSLEPDSSLANLGSTRIDALIVVVPSLTKSNFYNCVPKTD
jgi:hypothetical protein